MTEILMVTKNEILVRKLHRDEDVYNLFPRGEYEEWEASLEDIKRISPQLWEELHK